MVLKIHFNATLCVYSQSDFKSAVHSNQETLFPPGPAEELNPWFCHIQAADGFGQCLQRSCQFLINDSSQLKSSGGWTAPLIRLQICCWWCTSLHLSLTIVTSMHLSPPPWSRVLTIVTSCDAHLSQVEWVDLIQMQNATTAWQDGKEITVSPQSTFDILPHSYWQLCRDVWFNCRVQHQEKEIRNAPQSTRIDNCDEMCSVHTFLKRLHRKIWINCRSCKRTQNHSHNAIHLWQLVSTIVKISEVLQLDLIKMQWQWLGGNQRHTTIHLWLLVLKIMKIGAIFKCYS